MRFREILDADRVQIHQRPVDMRGALSRDETAIALVRGAVDLVPCDHGGYAEIDVHFDRTRLFSSFPEIGDWVQRRAAEWQHHMPEHPVLRYREANPDVEVVRLSDVADLSKFYRRGLYNELFRERSKPTINW